MIESLELQRFRAFGEVRLNGLRLINVVVGSSAAGKTALLEGVRLALAGTPQAALDLNAARGLNVYFPFNGPHEQFERVWNSLFHDFRTADPILLNAIDSEGRQSALSVFFDAARSAVVSAQVGAVSVGHYLGWTVTPIAFRRRSFTGEETTLHASVNQAGQIHVEGGQELGISAAFLPAMWQYDSPRVAGWFSQLDVANGADDVTAAVRSEFGDVIELSVQSPSPSPALYATMRHRARKMPLSLVSGGINKFVALLVAVQAHPSGVLLIDEMENGIYFRIFPAL